MPQHGCMSQGINFGVKFCRGLAALQTLDVGRLLQSGCISQGTDLEVGLLLQPGCISQRTTFDVGLLVQSGCISQDQFRGSFFVAA